MSAMVVAPELMAQAAADLVTIGESLNAAHISAAAPTVALLPAATDEVSTSIAYLFSGYGQEYQKLAGEAAAPYEQFAKHLTAGAEEYASTEAVNVASLQPATASAGSIGSIAGLLDLFGLLNPLTVLMGGSCGAPATSSRRSARAAVVAHSAAKI